MIMIDANVIVKLALQEPDSLEVSKTVYDSLFGGEEIVTVDIALAEALNALWKHNVIVKDLNDAKFHLGCSEIIEFWNNIDKVEGKDIAAEAKDIAKASRLTVYDSFYVAAALKNKAVLFTFDKKIIANAEKLKVKLLKLNR